MDSSLIVSIVIAVVAIVPGVWALVNQANKDKKQVQIDMNKAANDAAMSIISPLQSEVTRLQLRVVELEKVLVEKTTEVGELMQAGIDKDSQIRRLTYTVDDMQLRLNAFETKRKASGKPKSKDERAIEDPRLEEDLKADEARKEEIKNNMQKTIEQITNGSLVNNNQNIKESEE